MAYFTAPAQPLTDGVVALRLPSSDAGDADAVRGYIDQQQLDDWWLSMSPDESAGDAVTDWLHGWEGRPSRNGPAFVVTIPGTPRFIGQVSFTDRGQGVVEMEYGIAPRWRRRGPATRAARLAARWALSLPDVTAVELRIAQQNTASQHVAVNAGFAAAGTVTQFVPSTGKTFEDLCYILGQQLEV